VLSEAFKSDERVRVEVRGEEDRARAEGRVRKRKG